MDIFLIARSRLYSTQRGKKETQDEGETGEEQSGW